MNVTDITIDSKNETYMATDEAIYNKDKSLIIYYFARKENVTLEEEVRHIGSYCFITNTNMIEMARKENEKVDKLDRLT